jgi:hypothetical protein
MIRAQDEHRIRHLTREAIAQLLAVGNEVAASSLEEAEAIAVKAANAFVEKAVIRIGQEMPHLQVPDVGAVMVAVCNEVLMQMESHDARHTD